MLFVDDVLIQEMEYDDEDHRREREARMRTLNF